MHDLTHLPQTEQICPKCKENQGSQMTDNPTNELIADNLALDALGLFKCDRPRREELFKGIKQSLEDKDALLKERDEVIGKLREALEKTLASLVSYKRYIPEPYKQNPIYIMGSIEAEKLADEALKLTEPKE